MEMNQTFQQSMKEKKLTFAEKLNQRINILSDFIQKNAVIRDKIRNVVDHLLANENDNEVIIESHFRIKFFEGQLERLYAETE